MVKVGVGRIGTDRFKSSVDFCNDSSGKWHDIGVGDGDDTHHTSHQILVFAVALIITADVEEQVQGKSMYKS